MKKKVNSALDGFDVPQDVSDLECAFGGDMKKLLPPYNQLPKEFQDYHNNPHCKIVEEWFFRGLKSTPQFAKGIDTRKAMSHLKAVLSSWEPKHEHKIAGAGFLLAKWGVKGR